MNPTTLTYTDGFAVTTYSYKVAERPHRKTKANLSRPGETGLPQQLSDCQFPNDQQSRFEIRVQS